MVFVSNWIYFTTNQPDKDTSVIDANFFFRRIGNCMELQIVRIYAKEPDMSHQLDVPSAYNYRGDVEIHTNVEEFVNPYDLKTYYRKTTKRKREVEGWVN